VLGLAPIAGAPPARADGLDSILDPIVNSITDSMTHLDLLVGLDPSAGLDLGGLDLGALDPGMSDPVDVSVAPELLTAAANPAEPALSAPSTASSVRGSTMSSTMSPARI